jgi:nucleoid-associated protein YgaU
MLQATPPMRQEATVATAPPAPGHPAEPLSPPALPGTQPAALPNQDSPQLRTHIVGPNDSLGDISVRYLGKFDGKLLQEILVLNDDVKDPNHIEVGQRIRLPQAVSNPDSERSAANAERDSTNSPRKEP